MLFCHSLWSALAGSAVEREKRRNKEGDVVPLFLRLIPKLPQQVTRNAHITPCGRSALRTHCLRYAPATSGIAKPLSEMPARTKTAARPAPHHGHPWIVASALPDRAVPP